MTRDQFIIELGTHLRSGLRTEDMERLILADADDYAAGYAEEVAHPPYRPPLRFGYAPPVGNRTEGRKAQ
jgi:hypothetical protein